MQVLPNAIIINLSPSQRELVRNPKHSKYVQGLALDENSSRPRIAVAEIPRIIEQFRQLQSVISDDPEYAKRQPREVVEQIVLKITDALAAQRRAYPGQEKSN
jgi:hypothetical protein